MSLGLLRAIIWPFAALGLAALLAAAFTPLEPTPALAPPVTEPPPGTTTRVRTNLDSIARVLTERDLFRRSRRPGPVGAVGLGTGASPAPVAPRPVLTLMGIVTGPEPSAVVEGFPGVQGPRVVRPGDVIGEFLVRRISRMTVEISGMDTVWVLTVREPWK